MSFPFLSFPFYQLTFDQIWGLIFCAKFAIISLSISSSLASLFSSYCSSTPSTYFSCNLYSFLSHSSIKLLSYILTNLCNLQKWRLHFPSFNCLQIYCICHMKCTFTSNLSVCYKEGYILIPELYIFLLFCHMIG